MADNDSRTAGVLQPIEAQNTSEVETRLRFFVAQITGLDKKLVRTRWLKKPGTQPTVDTDWCAVGILGIRTNGTPNIKGKKGNLDDPESGDVVSIAHQTLDCMATFYGPNASYYADVLRSGMTLAQNNAWLQSQGLTVHGLDEIRRAPDFIFNQWIDRYDLSFRVGRKVSYKYGVRTIVDADFEISTEKGKL
jgi:hypothetical protein